MPSALEALYEAWHRAWLEKDATTVDRLMARDYVYIAPNGQVLDRAALLGIIRSPSYRILEGGRTEISVRSLGEGVGAVLYRWRGHGTFDGKTFSDDHRCTMIWTREGQDWKVALEQCSPIGS